MITRMKNRLLDYVSLESAGSGSGSPYWWLLPGDHHCFDDSSADVAEGDGRRYSRGLRGAGR